MKPLYATRIQDLGPGDFVKVECIACGHVQLMPPNALVPEEAQTRNAMMNEAT